MQVSKFDFDVHNRANLRRRSWWGKFDSEVVEI